MRITAPTSWLDEVDIASLRAWFIARGWAEEQNGLLSGSECSVILPANLRSFRDWRNRLLEAIETAALVEGITAAEWFARERK